MIVPVDVDVKFRDAAPLIKVVSGHVKDIITRHLDGSECAFIGRTKTAESLAEKIETGRFASWSELDDLYGCSIIVPTLADEPKALAFLRATFREKSVKQRGGGITKDPQIFRFDSTRFTGTLRPTSTDEQPGALSTQRFEVQIRTAFEHAWALATHKLAYKSNTIDWRRLRLAAQLKSSTEQLDHLIAGFDVVSDLIVAEKWPEVEHRKNIETLFRTKIADGSIPIECEPASWMRFTENVLAMLRAAVDRRLENADLDSMLSAVVRAIDATSGDKFPRSISLLQFVLGVISEAGFTKARLRRYTPMVTEQLRTTFPSVQRLEGTFAFNN